MWSEKLKSTGLEEKESRREETDGVEGKKDEDEEEEYEGRRMIEKSGTTRRIRRVKRKCDGNEGGRGERRGQEENVEERCD